MTDIIERLNERDDVRKTEYTYHESDEDVTVEMWHDVEGLQSAFQRVIDGVVAPRGIHKCAKENALAIRETSVSIRNS